jgi:hypothetical protein
MSLKLCFSSEIHRVSKPPVSFKALISHSQELFSSKLPTRWALEYIDEENDKVVLSSDHDYQALLEDVSKGKNVKIFITEKAEHSSFAVENFEQILESEPVQEAIPRPETKEAPKISKEESKIAEIQTQKTFKLFAPQFKTNEPLSPIAKSESKPHHKYKALGLMKKLAKPDLSKEEREKKEAKLTQIMAKLTPEDLQWATQQVNGHIETKPFGKNEKCKPHLKYKAAAIIKKLSENDIDPEIKKDREEKLNRLKSKLSPEDLRWAEDNAANVPANDQAREKCKNRGMVRAACVLRKMGNIETSKEDRERLQTKLTQLKEKLSPEDFLYATEQAANPEDESDCRKPMLKYKIRNIMRRLTFEPEMSPDDRQELEKKLSELKAKMSPENLAWVDEKSAKLQDKLKRVQQKRDKNMKEKLTSFLKESAGEIAGLLTGGEKQVKPAKLVNEFSEVFGSLSEDQQKEINAILKGVPQKIMDLTAEKRKAKEEKKMKKEKSRSKSPKKCEEKPKCRGFHRKQLGEKIEKVEAPKEYEKGVSRKADCLKEIFPEADLSKLLEFVAANNKLSTEDLIESYLANKK